MPSSALLLWLRWTATACARGLRRLERYHWEAVAAVGVEQALVGKPLTDQSIQEAAAKAADGLDPLGASLPPPCTGHISLASIQNALWQRPAGVCEFCC